MFAFVIVLGFLHPMCASAMLAVEPDSDSYHFVSHYRVSIDAPPDTVWEHLIDLGSWMYEFELQHVSGDPRKAGEVLRLYAEQNFFVQITKAIPSELLVIANLPSTFKGEFSTGIGVMTLHEIGAKTVVDLTMSRRYSWREEGENPMKRIRESSAFNQNTDAMWQDRFLERLRALSERSE